MFSDSLGNQEKISIRKKCSRPKAFTLNSIFFVSLVEINRNNQKENVTNSLSSPCKKKDNKTLYLFSLYILRMCASHPQFPISLSTRSPHIVLMCFYGEGYNRVDGFIVECRAVYVWSSYLRPNLFTRPCTQFPSFLPTRPAADLFVSQRQLCPSHPDYGVSSTDR